MTLDSIRNSCDVFKIEAVVIKTVNPKTGLGSILSQSQSKSQSHDESECCCSQPASTLSLLLMKERCCSHPRKRVVLRLLKMGCLVYSLVAELFWS